MKPSRKSITRPRRLSRRDKEEIELLNDYVVFSTELAGDLVSKFVSKLEDGGVRGTVRLDLDQIAVSLAAGDPETRGGPSAWPQQAMWCRYRHHFADIEAKKRLFEAIDTLLMRSLPDVVYCIATGDPATFGPDALYLPWNDDLMPKEAAPHLLRQWVRDRAHTEDFLTALFAHFERIADEQSIERRKLLIGQNAFSVGFKPFKQAERLMKLGNFFIPKQDDLQKKEEFLHRQAATVGRFIGRLRRQAQVRMQILRPRLRTGVEARRKPLRTKQLSGKIRANRTQLNQREFVDVRDT
jgi:hypothetical protein